MKLPKGKKTFPEDKPINGVMSRVCSVCECWLPADEAHFYPAPPYGLRRRCLACDRLKRAEAHQRLKQREKKPREIVQPKCDANGKYVRDDMGNIVYERLSIEQIFERRQQWVDVLKLLAQGPQDGVYVPGVQIPRKRAV